jgi:deoxyribose-phosphate aldolase
MNTLAGMIDHTLLKPEAVYGEYTVLVRQAVEHQFKSVCVNSFFVPLVSSLVNTHPYSNLSICSVVGFPFGVSDIHTKSLEVERAIAKGASEIDAVVNISAVRSGDWKRVKDELTELREASEHHILKVILETGLLTDDEIKRCCALAVECNLDFVKSSTGVNIKLPPEKTAEHVKLMKDCVNGSRVRVKASGGIKTLKDCKMMIDAGASRIGTSNGVSIMNELKGESK